MQIDCIVVKKIVFYLIKMFKMKLLFKMTTILLVMTKHRQKKNNFKIRKIKDYARSEKAKRSLINWQWRFKNYQKNANNTTERFQKICSYFYRNLDTLLINKASMSNFMDLLEQVYGLKIAIFLSRRFALLLCLFLLILTFYLLFKYLSSSDFLILGERPIVILLIKPSFTWLWIVVRWTLQYLAACV